MVNRCAQYASMNIVRKSPPPPPPPPHTHTHTQHTQHTHITQHTKYVREILYCGIYFRYISFPKLYMKYDVLTLKHYSKAKWCVNAAWCSSWRHHFARTALCEAYIMQWRCTCHFRLRFQQHFLSSVLMYSIFIDLQAWPWWTLIFHRPYHQLVIIRFV